MIRSFKHKGLKRFYSGGDRSGLSPDMTPKIGRVLQRLDEITDPSQMDLPGWRLHPMTGDLKSYWSVSITGNWRIIFKFEQGQPCDVELIDYH